MNIIQTTDKFILELYKNKKTHKKVHYKEKNKSKKQSPTLTLDQRPNFNNLLSEDMTEDDLQCCLGQRWRVLLGNLGSIVDIYQSVVTKKRYLPYVISSHSKRLNQVFNTHQTVSNVISLAVRVGLLYVAFEDASYTKGLAKEYYYNKDMERVIKILVDKYDINKRSKKNNSDNDMSIIIGANEFSDKGYKVRFSSKLRIANMTDEEILYFINKNYPTLKYHQAMADEMNKYLPPEQQISYVVTIHRSEKGYVTKLGIRATSSICNLKTTSEDGEDSEKEVYLTSQNTKIEFDVKSSVPRVAYLLRTGIWEDMSVDLYEKMFGPFESKEMRTAYKNTFMPSYFDNAGSIFNHNKDYIPESLKEYGEDTCKEMFKELVGKVTNVLGESLDSEIFFHESNIYLTFVKWLRDRGIKVTQIYDGFYANEDLSKYEWKLKEIAEDYYNNEYKVYYDKSSIIGANEFIDDITKYSKE